MSRRRIVQTSHDEQNRSPVLIKKVCADISPRLFCRDQIARSRVLRWKSLIRDVPQRQKWIVPRGDLCSRKICQFPFAVYQRGAPGATGAYHSLVAVRSLDAFTPAPSLTSCERSAPRECLSSHWITSGFPPVTLHLRCFSAASPVPATERVRVSSRKTSQVSRVSYETSFVIRHEHFAQHMRGKNGA